MEIKKAIEGIVEDFVRTALPGVVRSILSETLERISGPGLRTEGFRTVLIKASGRVSERDSRPASAVTHGVNVGQRWRGKSYAGSRGRLIVIASLGKDKVVPKVLRTQEGRSAAAKQISYPQLLKTYELVKTKS